MLRLRPTSDYCVLGELAAQVGWNRSGIVASLEAKRLAKSERFFQNKQKKVAARKAALGDNKVAAVSQELAKHGF